MDEDSRSGMAILQESLKEFSTVVYSKLKGSKPKTNLIFSPLSIAAALYNLLLGKNVEGTSYNQQYATHCSLLSLFFLLPSSQGARAETRAQMEQALKLPLDFSCSHYEMKKVKEVMKDTLSMASAMFYSPGSHTIY